MILRKLLKAFEKNYILIKYKAFRNIELPYEKKAFEKLKLKVLLFARLYNTHI